HVTESVYRLSDLFVLHHEIDDLSMAARQRFEIGNEMWVGQKSHIEQQVEGVRHTVLVAEAHDSEHHIEFRAERGELVYKIGPQRVDCMIRSIDNQVGQIANRLHQLLLGTYSFEQVVCSLYKRMRPPGLREPALQRLVARLQKDEIAFHIG